MRKRPRRMLWKLGGASKDGTPETKHEGWFRCANAKLAAAGAYPPMVASSTAMEAQGQKHAMGGCIDVEGEGIVKVALGL